MFHRTKSFNSQITLLTLPAGDAIKSTQVHRIFHYYNYTNKTLLFSLYYKQSWGIFCYRNIGNMQLISLLGTQYAEISVLLLDSTSYQFDTLPLAIKNTCR